MTRLPFNSPMMPTSVHVAPHARVYRHLQNIAATSDAISMAAEAYRDIPFKERVGHVAITCAAFDAELALEDGKPFQQAIDQAAEQPLFFAITPVAPELKAQWSVDISGITHMFDRTARAEFLLYYESYIDFVKDKAGHNHSAYPTPWDFARVVRNAIGHGRINISDEKFKPVSWYGLTYGKEQDRREIFGTDLVMPDLWILMYEMDIALHRLGHPSGAP